VGEKVIGRAAGLRWPEKKMWIIREWIIREWIIREWGRLTRWMGGYALKFFFKKIHGGMYASWSISIYLP
jgi:hypothetical protein